MSAPLHDDELTVDDALVRALIEREVPALADVPLRRLEASGSSNVLYRLGDELVVRLPRQVGGSATIAKEARWLPYVATHVSTRVPHVVDVGEPGLGYPEKWSLTAWIDGEVPRAGVGGAELAQDLAAFVRELRAMPVPSEAREDADLRWYRGGPLRDLDETMRVNLDACRAIPALALDLDAVERVWDEVMGLPDPAAEEDRWLHGDLVTENLLVRRGRLTAVLDLGGLALGDPSVDLVVAWEVLDAPARRVFRDALGVNDATWLRGRAWALVIALMTFDYYWTTMPERCRDRLVMAQAALEDESASAAGPSCARRPDHWGTSPE